MKIPIDIPINKPEIKSLLPPGDFVGAQLFLFELFFQFLSNLSLDIFISYVGG